MRAFQAEINYNTLYILQAEIIISICFAGRDKLLYSKVNLILEKWPKFIRCFIKHSDLNMLALSKTEQRERVYLGKLIYMKLRI